MNPQDFSWSEDQQVTVTNPTTKTYHFKVHNKDYAVEAGQTVKMAGYMAWLYVHGLATQMCQADDKFSRWNEEGFRQEYYDKLVAGADELVKEVEVEPVIEPVDAPQVEAPAPGTGGNYVPNTAPVQTDEKVGRRGRSAKV
jgi:hypothetical protein